MPCSVLTHPAEPSWELVFRPGVLVGSLPHTFKGTPGYQACRPNTSLCRKHCSWDMACGSSGASLLALGFSALTRLQAILEAPTLRFH